MADTQLRYVLTGTDQSASKTISGTADKASSAAAKIGSTFSRLGSTIGGEVGEIADQAGDLFDKIGESGGASLSEKLAVGGTAIAGIGAALTAMGDKDKAAEQQLSTAVQNAGGNFEELEGKVKSVDAQMAKYGDTTAQTDDALTTLVTATKSPTEAIAQMGTAANLAATQHISLNDAAKLLAKGLAGSSTRIFTQYGIQVKTNADGTKDYAGAVTQLGQALSGEADAQADTFTGKLKGLRTEVENGVAEFGQKYGPALTTVGVGMVTLGPLISKTASGVQSLTQRFRSSGTDISAANDEIVTSNTLVATSAESTSAEVATSEEAMAASAETASGEIAAAGEVAGVGIAGMLGPIGLAVGALSLLGVGLLESGKNAQSAAINVQDLTQKLIDNSGALDGNVRASVSKSLADAGILKQASGLHLNLSQVTDAVLKQGDAYGSIMDQLTAYDNQTVQLYKDGKISGDEADDRYDKVNKLRDAIKQNADQTTKAVEAEKDYTASSKEDTAATKDKITAYGVASSAVKTAQAAIDKQTQSTKSSTLQMRLENDAIDLVSQAFDKLNGKTLSEVSAQLSFKDAEQSVTDAVKQNGTSLNTNTSAGRSNTESIISAIQAAQSHAEAVGKQTGSTVKATAAYRSDITALESHATKAGLDRSQIDKLVKSIGGMPKVKSTKIDVDTAAAAAKLKTLRAELEAGTAGVDWTVNVKQVNSGGNANVGNGVKAEAAGTDYFSGGATKIAEREPEIIAGRGVSITPLSKLGGGSPAPQINLTIQAPAVYPGNSAELSRYLVGQLEHWANSGGRIAISKAVI